MNPGRPVPVRSRCGRELGHRSGERSHRDGPARNPRRSFGPPTAALRLRRVPPAPTPGGPQCSPPPSPHPAAETAPATRGDDAAEYRELVAAGLAAALTEPGW